MTNSEVMEINMEEFSLDVEDKENSNNQPKQLDNLRVNEGNKKSTDNYFVKQAFKDTTKIMKKKNPDQIEKHQELVLVLSRYGQSKRFSEYLKTYHFNLSVTHLKKMEIEDLEETLSRVQICLDNKSVSAFWTDLALGTVQTGEAIVCSTKLGKKIHIQGLTEILRNNSEFLDILEILELKHQGITHTSPEIRLIYSIVTSAMKIHSVNSLLEKRLSIIKNNAEKEAMENNEERDKQEEKVGEDVSQESKNESQESQNESQESQNETQESKNESPEPEVLSFE